MSGKVLYGPDDRPPPMETALLSCQHLVLVFGSYLMPAIVARAADLPPETASWILFASLLAGAAVSLVQAYPLGPLGSGFLVMACCSSAFMVCAIEAIKVGGMALAATLTLLAAPLKVFMGAKLVRFQKGLSAVAGIIVLLVGVTVLPLALDLWRGMGSGDLRQNLALGVFTMALMALCSRIRWRRCNTLAPVLAILGGCAAAHWLGILDLSRALALPLIGLPSLQWPSLAMPQWRHLPLLAAFLMAALASSAENLANGMAVQRLSRPQSPLDYKRLRGGLWADAAGSVLCALLGGLPNTTGAANVAAIGFTGVASRQVGAGAALLLVLMALSPKISGLILAVPAPVLGAISVMLAASILGTGFWMIGQEPLDRTVLGPSLAVGVLSATGKLFPEVLPPWAASFLASPVAAGGVTALVLAAARLLSSPGSGGPAPRP